MLKIVRRNLLEYPGSSLQNRGVQKCLRTTHEIGNEYVQTFSYVYLSVAILVMHNFHRKFLYWSECKHEHEIKPNHE